MSKRLQVLLPDQEMTEIQRFARRERVTVGEWVRRVLREARMRQPVNKPEVKLKAVRKASRYSFPAPDIEQMLSEIEQGYRS
jgi:hypothetical protein